MKSHLNHWTRQQGIHFGIFKLSSVFHKDFREDVLIWALHESNIDQSQLIFMFHC